MKVLLLSSLYPPFLGGAERQAERLARALQQAGVTVTILTQPAPGMPLRSTDEGVTVIRGLNTFPLGPIWGASYMMQTWRWLRLLKAEWDVVHNQQVSLHSYPSVGAARTLGRPALLRFACAGEGGDLARLLRVRYGRLLLPRLRQADRFVALSDELVDEIICHGFDREKVREIPNGVDVDMFRPPSIDSPTTESLRLLFVGRLDRQKGVADLVDALAALPGALAWSARIVGDGPERSFLEQKVTSCGLRQRIAFLGQQSEVISHYHWANLFVLPSHFEGMPNVILEAMACGLPILATDIGGTRELVVSGLTGWLVAPAKPRELRDALAGIAGDMGRLAMVGMAARRRVLATFSMATVARAYITEYESILRRPTALPATVHG